MGGMAVGLDGAWRKDIDKELVDEREGVGDVGERLREEVDGKWLRATAVLKEEKDRFWKKRKLKRRMREGGEIRWTGEIPKKMMSWKCRFQLSKTHEEEKMKASKFESRIESSQTCRRNGKHAKWIRSLWKEKGDEKSKRESERECTISMRVQKSYREFCLSYRGGRIQHCMSHNIIHDSLLRSWVEAVRDASLQ
jgi:hypothetical protein